MPPALMIAGAWHALQLGGVLAMTVRSTAEFEDGTPVGDLRTAVGRVMGAAGFDHFLGNPVVSVGRSRARAHSGAWLIPEVTHVVVARKA